jgi:hypothetical protein
MSRSAKLASHKIRYITLGLVLLVLWLAGSAIFPVSGERLGSRALQLANNQVSASDQYYL